MNELDICARMETLQKDLLSVKDERKALLDQLKQMQAAARDRDGRQKDGVQKVRQTVERGRRSYS